MKVASISHMFPNAANPNNGVFVKERLKHVAQKIDLDIIAPVPSFPFIGHTAKYGGLVTVPGVETVDGLRVHHPRYFMIPKFFKFLDAGFFSSSMSSFMERMIREHDYDILDFHWVYPDGIGGLDWARRLGKRTVVTVRGNEAIYYFERNRLRRIVQKRLAEFDHIITVSSDLRNKVVSEYNVPPDRVTVIQNGIDSGKFQYMERSPALERCGLSNDRPYILTVSRLSAEKGLDTLLKAFARMTNRDAELIIIGDGPLKGALLSLCSDLGITERVHFKRPLGHADICCWYNAADLFCLPSRWEGCPNVVIEALACGTPVVATQVGGIPDLVREAGHGLLVPPDDADALAASLSSALSIGWNRRMISASGATRSWEDVADMVIDVFHKVLT